VAILEATLSGEYVGQLTINRWHYVSSGDPGPITPSFGLMVALGFLIPGYSATTFILDTVAKQLQNAVVGAFSFRAIYVRNLYEPADFVENAFPVGITGSASGEAASPVLAYGLNSTRVRTDIRRGQKRFAGVSEAAMNPGGVLTGPVLSELTALAGWMSDVLTYDDAGASLSFTPTVLQYEQYSPSPGKTAYRPYATEAEQLAHSAQGVTWSVKDRVRSQVSRQVGRGI